MNVNILWKLAIFVLVLLVLNAFFDLHISVIASLALTVGLSLLFSLFQRR